MCPLFSSLSRPDRISRLAFYDPIEKTTIFSKKKVIMLVEAKHGMIYLGEFGKT